MNNEPKQLNPIDVAYEASKDYKGRPQFKPEHQINLDDLVQQGRNVKHNWVQRGDKLSCEGAGHPHHSHFLVKKR